MFNKIAEFLYPKIFINIIASKEESTVFVETYSQNKFVSSEEESFSTATVNLLMIEYIDSFILSTPYFYTSILDKSIAQGVVPTCSDIKKYIDTSLISSICKDKKYSYYTSQYDLKELKNDYKTIGLDFIFSPFIILNKFFTDKIDDHLAIFLLIENGAISLSIFNNAKLLYAQRLDMDDDMMSDGLGISDDIDDDDEEISLDLESINLDDVDENIESLEDFGDIQDIDTGIDIDEFSEEEDVDENTEDDYDGDASLDGMNEDYQRFILIQESINIFYQDDKYDSEFIENIYIADSINVSNDLKKYLEEEMFLNVIIRKMDLAQELSDMAKAEIL